MFDNCHPSSDCTYRGSDDFRDAWDATEPSREPGLLPPGDYIADLISGRFELSKWKKTPCYKLRFRIFSPSEFAGQNLWHSLWLTSAALPNSKRDLKNIGVKTYEQARQPLSKILRCRVRVTVRIDEAGEKRNQVARFSVTEAAPPDQEQLSPAGLQEENPKVQADKIDPLATEQEASQAEEEASHRRARTEQELYDLLAEFDMLPGGE